LWDGHAQRAGEIKVGDIVKFTEAYSSLGLFGFPEIHLGRRGDLRINPPGEELPRVEEKEVSALLPRAKIGEIEGGRARVEIRGTVTRIFHRRPLFDVCPNCGTSLGTVDTSLLCEQCGKVVSPEHRAVLSFLLDDGTGSVRVVLFGMVAERLFGMSANQILRKLKETPDLAEFYGGFGFLGKEFIIAGVVRQDKYSNQLELRGYEIKIPDAKGEVKHLLESIKERTTKVEEERV
jgi:replication factor A1